MVSLRSFGEDKYELRASALTFYSLLSIVPVVAMAFGVAKYNAIYGSFATVSFFLIWLQLSWLVVLLGAGISFAHHNVDIYKFEPDSLKVSYSFKRLLSLNTDHFIIKSFSSGDNLSLRVYSALYKYPYSPCA